MLFKTGDSTAQVLVLQSIRKNICPEKAVGKH
jgi:hypothetical protein